MALVCAIRKDSVSRFPFLSHVQFFLCDLFIIIIISSSSSSSNSSSSI